MVQPCLHLSAVTAWGGMERSHFEQALGIRCRCWPVSMGAMKWRNQRYSRSSPQRKHFFLPFGNPHYQRYEAHNSRRHNDLGIIEEKSADVARELSTAAGGMVAKPLLVFFSLVSRLNSIGDSPKRNQSRSKRSNGGRNATAGPVRIPAVTTAAPIDALTSEAGDKTGDLVCRRKQGFECFLGQSR